MAGLRSSARGTRVLVLAGAALLALSVPRLHEGFVPPPAPRPTQNTASASACLLGSLGALLRPADSFAAAAAKAAAAPEPDPVAVALKKLENAPAWAYKGLFESNLYAFNLPFFSWNLFWLLVALLLPAGILFLGAGVGIILSPAEESGTRFKPDAPKPSNAPKGAVMLPKGVADKSGKQSPDWR